MTNAEGCADGTALSNKRKRAETHAARSAQARRDNTIKVQEMLEGVIPQVYLETHEDERVSDRFFIPFLLVLNGFGVRIGGK